MRGDMGTTRARETHRSFAAQKRAQSAALVVRRRACVCAGALGRMLEHERLKPMQTTFLIARTS